MGVSREMYQDEKIVNRIHQQLPSLMTQIWFNHSYHNSVSLNTDIVESIDYLITQLEDLKKEVTTKDEK